MYIHLRFSPILPISFLSTVRIVDVKKVYDDGTITDFNATSTARRLLLRTQIGVEVDYFITTPQSQAATQALMSQNSTRAAMSKVLRSNQSNAVLKFPRYSDTVPPTSAPTPVPTVEPSILTYSVLVGVCVVGGIIALVGSIVLGIYGRRRHVKRKERKLQYKLGINSPDVTSPNEAMDLEGGDQHDVFQRPRMFTGYDDDDEKDDNMDKESSDLSSIAMSVTEILTPMISSGPSSMLIKSGEIIGVSSDQSGSGRSASKGFTGSSLDGSDPLVCMDDRSVGRNTVSLEGKSSSPTKGERNRIRGHDEGKHDDENVSDDSLLNASDRYAATWITRSPGATNQVPTTSASSFLLRTGLAGILRAHNEHHDITSSTTEVDRPPDMNIHDAFRGMFLSVHLLIFILLPLPIPFAHTHPRSVW